MSKHEHSWCEWFKIWDPDWRGVIQVKLCDSCGDYVERTGGKWHQVIVNRGLRIPEEKTP